MGDRRYDFGLGLKRCTHCEHLTTNRGDHASGKVFCRTCYDKKFPVSYTGDGTTVAESVTRWERAAAAVNGLASAVAKIDPDGVDVYCFHGEGVERHECITDGDLVEEIVEGMEPHGRCHMGQVFDTALNDAKAKGSEKPVSMLVITAGLPDDEDSVIARLKQAVQEQHEYLTITFVQIGDDPQAEVFLKHLDDNLTTKSGRKTVDIIDTLKDEEIQSALAEMQEEGDTWKRGALIGSLLGAVGGMALGAFAAHRIDKHYEKKRTEGWNGNWEVIVQPGDKPTGTILKVTDTMDGLFSIEGYPTDVSDDSCGRACAKGSYKDMPGRNPEESWLSMRRIANDGGTPGNACKSGCGRKPFKTFPTCCTHCKGNRGPHAKTCSRRRAPRRRKRYVKGTVVDEHLIEWSDNTSWREVVREGKNWAAIGAGAAVGGLGGAAIGGAIGALIQKQFFSKAASGTPADYMILLDCSSAMTALDTGPGHSAMGRAVKKIQAARAIQGDHFAPDDRTPGGIGRDLLRAALT